MAGADTVAGRRTGYQAMRARQAALDRLAVLDRLATLDRLDREAAERVYSAGSADRVVVADVDGTGRLRDLTIDPAALPAADPERVGRQIVGAVTRARQHAAADRAELIRRELGAERAP